MSSFSNKWFSFRNSDPCFFHILFKTLRGYYDWDLLCQHKILIFQNFFLGVSFFSPFLKAFFGNKGAPYLLLIWFKVLKFIVRFYKKQCIAHKNEKHARVFDYFFHFIRELITFLAIYCSRHFLFSKGFNKFLSHNVGKFLPKFPENMGKATSTKDVSLVFFK